MCCLAGIPVTAHQEITTMEDEYHLEQLEKAVEALETCAEGEYLTHKQKVRLKKCIDTLEGIKGRW